MMGNALVVGAVEMVGRQHASTLAYMDSWGNTSLSM